MVEKIQESMSSEKRMIYLGDGVGDFCPCLKLKETDIMMPRKGFPVWDLISENKKLIKGEIHEWTDGDELEHVLIHLIKSIIEDEKSNSSQLVSVDCKLQTITVSAH